MVRIRVLTLEYHFVVNVVDIKVVFFILICDTLVIHFGYFFDHILFLFLFVAFVSLVRFHVQCNFTITIVIFLFLFLFDQILMILILILILIFIEVIAFPGLHIHFGCDWGLIFKIFIQLSPFGLLLDVIVYFQIQINALLVFFLFLGFLNQQCHFLPLVLYLLFDDNLLLRFGQFFFQLGGGIENWIQLCLLSLIGIHILYMFYHCRRRTIYADLKVGFVSFNIFKIFVFIQWQWHIISACRICSNCFNIPLFF